MRTHPAYGRGMAFPLRVNPSTGATVVTEGLTDAVSVALEYFNEAWTVREDTTHPENHIAEAIAHILLTHKGEHDTLPEFGSRVREIVFEPNSLNIRNILKHFFQESTIRWEKRARFPEDGGFEFRPSGYLTDEGILPALGIIEFILDQVPGNLVAPFVNPRQARAQEYPLGMADDSGHDYYSRYHGIAQAEHDGITYTRFGRPQPIEPNYDDQFYTIKHGDTWLRISWKLYHDIRYWPYIARMWVQDAAEEGLTRHNLDPSQEPEPGTILRVPSETRIRTEVSRMRDY